MSRRRPDSTSPELDGRAGAPSRWALPLLLSLLTLACDSSHNDSSQPATTGKKTPSETALPDASVDVDAAMPAQDASQPDATASAPTPTKSCGPEGSCDLRDPDSCETGSSCVLTLASSSPDEDAGVADVATACLEAGTGLDGEPCSSQRQCATGLDCTASGNQGLCRRYCCDLNRTSGCPAGQFCRIELLDATDETTGAALCDRCDGCDLLGDDCGDGLGCYPLAIDPPCMACLPAGQATAGDSCGFANDCASGSVCVGVDAQARCMQTCDLAAPNCETDETCRTVEGAPYGDGVGLCAS
ncbi:MAG: hypothetical protein OEZ06_10545 [Myxococcales bacterium]|nr:hypothetical protein [Myxococcales bacterium]